MFGLLRTALPIVPWLLFGPPFHAPALGVQELAEFCGTFAERGEYEMALHRFQQERHRALGVHSRATASIAQVGNIAVIEADERLLLPANPFDLEDRAVAFEPRSTQGYRASHDDSSLERALGRQISLTTYGWHPIDLPFSFPFYGAPRTRVYVNANGSLTFNFGDGSWRTGASQLLTSLPRIAAFYSALDPAAGGRVLVAEEPARLVVTWSEIPERDGGTKSTFQVVLEAGGRIVVRFGRIEAPSGLVGVAFPFGAFGTDVIDLTLEGEGTGALFEEFRHERLVDRVATVRRFYESFPDLFDFVVLWTTFDSDLGGALAFETTVRNNVRGIGQSLFNAAGSWGSRGQLQSVVMLGDLANYPEPPDALIGRSERSTLAVVAHEVGHRWLTYVHFIDAGAKSNALLGRKQVHWSFFKDSDGSFLYGEEIAQESDDRFRTTDTWARFSNLDLYLMGFASAAEVAPFFLVADGSGQDGRGLPLTAETYPERGVSFRGKRRDVLLEDVVLAEGPREPAFERSQSAFRQAWILLHPSGAPPTAEEIGKLEAIRAAFEGYIQDKTLGRATMTTTLDP